MVYKDTLPKNSYVYLERFLVIYLVKISYDIPRKIFVIYFIKILMIYMERFLVIYLIKISYDIL